MNRTMKTKQYPHHPTAILAALVLLLPLSGYAQQNNFTGGNSTNWSVDSNWSLGVKPTSGNTVGIVAASGTPSIVDENFNVGSIAFATTSKTISINSGIALTLSGISGNLITNTAAASLTINGAGDLVLGNSGNVSVTNSGRVVSLQTRITETGGARQIVKTGAGTLSLLGSAPNSTFSGGVRLIAGVLNTNASSTGPANAPTSGPFGTGILSLEGGSFSYTGSSAGSWANQVSLLGDVSLDGTQSYTFSGSVGLGGAQRTLAVNQTVAISGVISNGGITKAGTGQLTLSRANDYAGSTVVSSGTLLLAGSASLASTSNVTLSGGTLRTGASEQLNNAAALTLSAGTLDVQTFTETLGALTLSGNSFITLGSGGKVIFDDSHSSIWGNFSINLTGFVTGSSLRFGTSNLGLTSGQLGKFVATGVTAFGLDTSGYLVAVPEPSTWALLGISLTLALVFRKRGSRSIE